MSDAKSERRILRFMQMLEKSPAVLRDTGSSDVKLLEFAGSRSVRCVSSDIEAMLRSGSIVVSRRDDLAVVRLTDAGQASLRRQRSGNVAGQHRQIREAHVQFHGHPHRVTLNDAESPLAVLARLKRPDGGTWFDGAEIAAGDRLRSDFEHALLQPRVTASWDISHVARTGGQSGAVEMADHVMAARDRVNAALTAVGPDLGGALVDVCCFLKGLEQVERERNWPRRSAKLMLKTALGLLDAHYDPGSARKRRSRKILHWGSDGFRPSLNC
jgi:hypothetical protein